MNKVNFLLVLVIFQGFCYSQTKIHDTNTPKIIIVERDTLRIEIEQLGREINSDFNDYAPVITADGEYMYFTSRRPSNEKEIKKNKESREMIYEAIWDEESKAWQQAEPLPKDVNLEGRNISNVAISNDGQRLIIYQDDKYGNGDLYEAYLNGSTWSAPLGLGREINSDAHESSASISPDGRTVYFVSDRKEGMGGRDIWKCTKQKDGTWSSAENLGKVINSKEDEEGVFIHPDGKTLYFSSKGHNSIGGYDIFKSVLGENGSWSKPINLGEPINSIENDLFFVLSASGKTGYYATARNGGVINIFQIRFIPIIQENEEPVNTGPKLTVFKGVVKDCETGNPIYATIEVTDNEKNEVIGTYNSNSETGKYLISLPSGKNYGININAQGYVFSSQSFDLTNDSISEYKEEKKDLCLDKIKVGAKVVLKNIFFDFNKSTLRNESIAELGRLEKILIDNPSMTIEIGGHTDSKGSSEYNKKLSNDRAQSVVNYLIEHGISSTRLSYKGYGKEQPVATNETEEGRQENRRVEFKIISN